jgi:hypothetical protein
VGATLKFAICRLVKPWQTSALRLLAAVKTKTRVKTSKRLNGTASLFMTSWLKSWVNMSKKGVRCTWKYGKFTNKDGHEQNTCDIIATEMQLLGGREGMGAPSGDEGGGSSGSNYNARPASAPRAPSAPAQQRPAAAKPAASGFDDMDDDIPF